MGIPPHIYRAQKLNIVHHFYQSISGRASIIGVLTLCVIAVAMVKTADAKQLYLITDHDISDLATCNINPAGGRVTDPVYYSPNPMYGAVGIAVDENATTLFISYEMSGSSNFAIVDATTLELIGTVNDPQWGTFTGIDMDDVNNIVYATHRFPDYPELPTGLYACIRLGPCC